MKDRITELYGCKKVLGPYMGSDGRRRCVLYFGEGKTTSRAYARLVIEASLGRKLLSSEHVDHIDGNKKNDAIENLQVLSDQAHRAKTSLEQSLKQCQKVSMACPVCGEDFKVSRWRLSVTEVPCCSRTCARAFKWRNQYTVGGMLAEGGGVEPPRRC